MNTTPPVLFLQNITLESPGMMLSFLEKRNIPYEIVDLYTNEKITKEPENYGAVVVLGGPMNVDEEAKYPFLKTEKAYIQRCYQDEVPVLGICLGGQLMASAAGARVKRNEISEIGWMNAAFSDEGRLSSLFEGIDSPMPVFQWHGDTFEIPSGGTKLAYSSGCQNQAFAFNQHSFGLQFHVEVNADDAKNWAEAYLDDVKEEAKETVLDLIHNPNHEQARKTAVVSEKLFGNFFGKIY